MKIPRRQFQLRWNCQENSNERKHPLDFIKIAQKNSMTNQKGLFNFFSKRMNKGEEKNTNNKRKRTTLSLSLSLSHPTHSLFVVKKYHWWVQAGVNTVIVFEINHRCNRDSDSTLKYEPTAHHAFYCWPFGSLVWLWLTSDWPITVLPCWTGVDLVGCLHDSHGSSGSIFRVERFWELHAEIWNFWSVEKKVFFGSSKKGRKEGSKARQGRMNDWILANLCGAVVYCVFEASSSFNQSISSSSTFFVLTALSFQLHTVPITLSLTLSTQAESISFRSEYCTLLVLLRRCCSNLSNRIGEKRGEHKSFNHGWMDEMNINIDWWMRLHRLNSNGDLWMNKWINYSCCASSVIRSDMELD